jgi:peptide deformylase
VLQCNGLFARCVLHEVDHLNGILFIDRMDKAAKASIKDAIDELARQTAAAKAARP